MQDRVVKLTRPELYERVWATPVSRVAPELGISDVGLRKICQRFDIPLPRLGYWAKKQHGKRVRQTPLRPIEGLDDEFFQFTVSEPDDYHLGSAAEVRDFEAREQQPEHHIHVAETLFAPHPLVERTYRSLDSASPDDVGLLSRKAKNCLDVVASRDTLNRAVRIMDAVVRALESRNLCVEAGESTTNSTSVVVLGERLKFLLEELTERRERAPTAKEKEEAAFWGGLRAQRYYERYPTGRLSLCISNGPTGMRHRWSDSGRQPLESLLNAFVRGLARNAEGRKLAEIVAERQRQEFQRLEEQRRMEAERQRLEAERQREEEARFQKLERMTDLWHRSERIRSLLEAIELATESCGTGIAPESEFGKWLAWAHSRADSLDPIRGVLDVAAGLQVSPVSPL